MRRRFLTRTLSLFLTLGLALPPNAHPEQAASADPRLSRRTLRPGIENAGLEEDIASRLQSTAASSAAGLEERSRINRRRFLGVAGAGIVAAGLLGKVVYDAWTANDADGVSQMRLQGGARMYSTIRREDGTRQAFEEKRSAVLKLPPRKRSQLTVPADVEGEKKRGNYIVQVEKGPQNDPRQLVIKSRDEDWDYIATPFEEADAELDLLRMAKDLQQRRLREGKKTPLVILDWGAGTGHTLREFADRLQKEGIDVILIAYANEYYREWDEAPANINYIFDVTDNLPQVLRKIFRDQGLPADQGVDFVYSYYGLYHLIFPSVIDRSQTMYVEPLRELLRVQTPGGVLRSFPAGGNDEERKRINRELEKMGWVVETPAGELLSLVKPRAGLEEPGDVEKWKQLRQQVVEQDDQVQVVKGGPQRSFIRHIPDALIHQQLDLVPQGVLDYLGLGYARIVREEGNAFHAGGISCVVQNFKNKRGLDDRLVSMLMVEDVLADMWPVYARVTLRSMGLNPDTQTRAAAEDILDKVHRHAVLLNVGQLIWIALPEGLQTQWERIFREEELIYELVTARSISLQVEEAGMLFQHVPSKNPKHLLARSVFAETYAAWKDPHSILRQMGQPSPTQIEQRVLEQSSRWIESQGEDLMPVPGTYRVGDSASGLEEAAVPLEDQMRRLQQVFYDLLERGDVQEALSAQRWIALDGEQSRGFGFLSSGGFIVADSATPESGQTMVVADDQLRNDAAGRMLSWVRAGGNVHEVIRAAAEMGMAKGIGNVIALEAEQGLTAPQVEKILRINGLLGPDAPPAGDG